MSNTVLKSQAVLMFHLAEAAREVQTATIYQTVQALIRTESLSEMDALKRVARERGIGKSEAYREFQREQSKPRRKSTAN